MVREAKLSMINITYPEADTGEGMVCKIHNLEMKLVRPPLELRLCPFI